jgi:anti-sigma B factor antagonist
VPPGDRTSRTILHVIEAESFTILEFEGEFDLSSATEIEQHAQAALASCRHLIFDLSTATFIDSSVIHALRVARDRATALGRACVLQLGTGSIVERALDIAAVCLYLPRAYDRAEAIRMIRNDSDAAARRTGS